MLLDSVDFKLTLEDTKQLLRTIDMDGNGTLQLEEFLFFFAKAADRDALKKMAHQYLEKDAKFLKERAQNAPR